MKELVILSGKGGTGKTTLAASFATLAKNAVFADCDVDAADLHLVLKPTILSKNEFISGHEAVIRQEDCIGCQACISHCRFDAIHISPESNLPTVSPISCEGCGVCHFFCPTNAIDFRERNCGEWYISQTTFWSFGSCTVRYCG
jgi:MinD superfamily P-loop ATPase